MDRQEHIEIHKRLHVQLDELAADWIHETGGLPSRCTLLEFMRWSHRQTLEPDDREGRYGEHADVSCKPDKNTGLCLREFRTQVVKKHQLTREHIRALVDGLHSRAYKCRSYHHTVKNAGGLVHVSQYWLDEAKKAEELVYWLEQAVDVTVVTQESTLASMDKPLTEDTSEPEEPPHQAVNTYTTKLRPGQPAWFLLDSKIVSMPVGAVRVAHNTDGDGGPLPVKIEYLFRRLDEKGHFMKWHTCAESECFSSKAELKDLL